ncbi:hypothetical protein P170DRAFT_430945 [Aspergillus steynii IBT 23096]|uniref:Uncharacterized protein n=1 Tax=Aspergillus steynii IBT 23096 TaxID=1392250 RepID=A0A2I2FTJ1_9EURO|nr:uncharacterized protein P170DRAFT_430945 [Aspergillus steynii IBT 23096]PLB43949.1 hypothetical protein P170DRAFT_430945 [Aspergillus steynii IBT 23096]
MWQRSRASRLWWTENWKPVDSATRESRLKRFDDRYDLHTLAIRAPPTPTSASNATTTSNLPSAPAKTHHSLVPHWSYEKNSIAVAIVISVVTAIAFITLAILFVQKVRRSWRRHKREIKDYSGSRYRVYYMNDSAENGGLEDKFSRESVMFGKDDSAPQEYFVEQEGDVVTRVYRAGKSDSTRTFDSVGKPREQQQEQQQQQSAPEQPTPQEIPVETVNAIDPVDPVNPDEPVSEAQPDTVLTVRENSKSISQPVVVVPPPLVHVSSSEAAPVTQPPDPLPEKPSFIPKTRNEARRSLVKLAADAGLLFRLPSIKKTTSPFYRP